MIGEHLEQYDFEYFKKNTLKNIPSNLDTRQGSIIYDATIPGAYNCAELNMNIREAYLNTSPYFATGIYLDNKVIEKGLIRYKATKSIKKIILKLEEGIEANNLIGARFSTINSDNIIYKIIEGFDNNTFLAECETPGTIGNGYIGDLLPITNIKGLEVATMSSLVKPARDDEDDNSLRARYFNSFNEERYSGNVADYKYILEHIEGVGGCQVYPTHEGGGTVKVSVVDTEFNRISEEFINIIENVVDPENAKGEKGTGLGLAGIGHKVTVVTPDIKVLNISTNIELDTGYTESIITPNIKKALDKYIKEIKMTWGAGDEMNNYKLNVYIAKLTSVILNVPGVNNITELLINGVNTDISLEQSPIKQEIPKIGEILVNG